MGALQGFGHTCVSCEDPAKFCQELEEKFGDKLDWSLKGIKERSRRLPSLETQMVIPLKF